MSSYVGKVLALSHHVDEKGNKTPGGERSGWYILSFGWFGNRKTKLIGDPGYSPFAEKVKAQVYAWSIGGPIPDNLICKEPIIKNKPDFKLLKFPAGDN